MGVTVGERWLRRVARVVRQAAPGLAAGGQAERAGKGPAAAVS